MVSRIRLLLVAALVVAGSPPVFGQPAGSGSGKKSHWAYVRPQRSALPQVSNRGWARNPIDRFVLARLETEGWQPSPEADRRTLLRRVSWDLTGLPPTAAESDAFARDESPDAYERAVERLLQSPQFGERMAVFWLDLARYADTHGYHMDAHRDMWRWRDWVIRAFQRNLPFNQFTVEQLAGDLLPDATLEQRIATGFLRNHMINFENGAIAEEYRCEYVVDRTTTTAIVWLGTTLQCARCHDHKHDPFSMRDFYRFYAYFNQVPENGLDGDQGNAAPYVTAPNEGQRRRLEELANELQRLEHSLKQRERQVDAELQRWEQGLSNQRQPASPAGLRDHLAFDERSDAEARNAVAGEPPGEIDGEASWVTGKLGSALLFDGQLRIRLPRPLVPAEQSFTASFWVFPTTRDPATLLSQLDESRGVSLALIDGCLQARLVHRLGSNEIVVRMREPLDLRRWQHVAWSYDGSRRASGVSLWVRGQPVPVIVERGDRLSGSVDTAKPLQIGLDESGDAFRGLLDDFRIYHQRLTETEIQMLAGADPLRELVAIPAAQRTVEQAVALKRFYLDNVDGEYRELKVRRADVERQRQALQKSLPTSMVMEELRVPRETRILLRGRYDSPGDRVSPGVPESLPPLHDNGPQNRVALARWLVARDQPLTARVMSNRFWELVFGTGLVRTSEDFGVRGEPASHPELLDWLAVEFMETGWDIKHLLRLIVTSSTYRQASVVREELMERDPENRLLARAPRLRLPAEMIRDGVLFASGLLDGRVGGPSVRPYQPPGLWEEVSYNPDKYSAQVYHPSHGSDLYRRSLYTFWKRSVPPPNLAIFDAPEREVCIVRRSRTNTPLQALVLLNDPTFVEAARAFALRMFLESPAGDESRIGWIFRGALGRPATAEETQIVKSCLEGQRAEFRRQPDRVRQLLEVGESSVAGQPDPAELAAWTVVTNLVFALDEMIVRN